MEYGFMIYDFMLISPRCIGLLGAFGIHTSFLDWNGRLDIIGFGFEFDLVFADTSYSSLQSANAYSYSYFDIILLRAAV